MLTLAISWWSCNYSSSGKRVTAVYFRDTAIFYPLPLYAGPGPLRKILAGGTKIVIGPPRLRHFARFAFFCTNLNLKWNSTKQLTIKSVFFISSTENSFYFIAVIINILILFSDIFKTMGKALLWKRIQNWQLLNLLELVSFTSMLLEAQVCFGKCAE